MQSIIRCISVKPLVSIKVCGVILPPSCNSTIFGSIGIRPTTTRRKRKVSFMSHVAFKIKTFRDRKRGVYHHRRHIHQIGARGVTIDIIISSSGLGRGILTEKPYSEILSHLFTSPLGKYSIAFETMGTNITRHIFNQTYYRYSQFSTKGPFFSYISHRYCLKIDNKLVMGRDREIHYHL
jgi:hypothetical protein